MQRYTINRPERLARLVLAYDRETVWGNDQRAEAIRQAYNILFHASPDARTLATLTDPAARKTQSDGI